MKKKIITKFISCLLVGAVLCIAPASKASSLGSFDTINRAAQAMSAAQMKMNKILDEINFKTNYYPTPPTPAPKPTPTNPTPVYQYNLKTFAIDSYIEHGAVNKLSNGTLHKSKLPLTILTWMSGFGNVTGVSIDGVQLETALIGKIAYNDVVDINKRCMEFITLDESVINTLSNGNHRIVVSCTGPYNSTYITYTDDFTFNLVD